MGRMPGTFRPLQMGTGAHLGVTSPTRRNASAERVTLSSEGGGRAYRERSNDLQLESINDEVRSFYRLLKVQRLLDSLQFHGSLLLADAGYNSVPKLLSGSGEKL